MNKKLRIVFQNTLETPPEGLRESIYLNIIRKEKRRRNFNLVFLSVTVLTSLSSLIPVVVSLINGLSRSGFYEYTSLIFSDSQALASVWKDFSFILAESLPIVSVVLTLVLLFVCLLSLKSLAKQIKKVSLLTV